GATAATVPDQFFWVDAKAISAAALGARADIFGTDAPQLNAATRQFVHDRYGPRPFNPCFAVAQVVHGGAQNGMFSPYVISSGGEIGLPAATCGEGLRVLLADQAGRDDSRRGRRVACARAGRGLNSGPLGDVLHGSTIGHAPAT